MAKLIDETRIAKLTLTFGVAGAITDVAAEMRRTYVSSAGEKLLDDAPVEGTVDVAELEAVLGSATAAGLTAADALRAEIAARDTKLSEAEATIADMQATVDTKALQVMDLSQQLVNVTAARDGLLKELTAARSGVAEQRILTAQAARDLRRRAEAAEPMEQAL